MPEQPNDYEELLRLFNKHRVRYCIVGAYALALHAVPRFTKDFDILLEPSLSNGKHVIEALIEFGFESLKLTADDFARPGRIIQLGYEPLRVDLLTSIDGCTFAEVWKHRVRGTYGRTKANFIGLDQLIRNKQESGRSQDLVDLKTLQQKPRKTRERKRSA